MQKKVNKKLIVLLVLASLALVSFLALTILTLVKYNYKIDGFNYFIANNRTEFLNGFFKIFTYLGSFYVLTIIVLIGTILIWFVFKNKRLAIFSLLTFGTTAIANYLIKLIVQRQRPDLMIIAETGFSFPSGHAMMSFAVIGILIYFAYKFLKNKPLKIALICLGVLLITLIGFSRIYLGVHYLTDIIAGWLITFVILVVFVILYNSKIFRGVKNEKNIV